MQDQQANYSTCKAYIAGIKVLSRATIVALAQRAATTQPYDANLRSAFGPMALRLLSCRDLPRVPLSCSYTNWRRLSVTPCQPGRSLGGGTSVLVTSCTYIRWMYSGGFIFCLSWLGHDVGCFYAYKHLYKSACWRVVVASV